MLTSSFISSVNALFGAVGLHVVKKKGYYELIARYRGCASGVDWESTDWKIDDASEQYLRFDNDRLNQLQHDYLGHPAAALPMWQSEHIRRDLTLRNFRAENPYIHQVRSSSIRGALPDMSYALTSLYALREDKGNFTKVIKEDGAFGCSIEAIHWWLKNLAGAGTRNSFIIPNFYGRPESLTSGDGTSHRDLPSRYGFKLMDDTHSYPYGPSRAYGVNPFRGFLFER